VDRKTISLALVVMLLATGVPSLADTRNDPGRDGAGQYAEEHARHAGNPYPLMADPLGDPLADVDKPVSWDYNGRELLFASRENADAFKADPDKYLGKVDQMVIEQQKPSYPLAVCVVSGEKLGGDMGEPVDYVYSNRLVRFCCKMCESSFNKDPDAYLARINTAVAEAQVTDYPTDRCIVSGDKFGGEMGEPVDYVIGTRLVRFCCPMCVTQFEANPARYLSELDGGGNHGGGGHGEHHDQDGDAHGHANHP